MEQSAARETATGPKKTRALRHASKHELDVRHSAAQATCARRVQTALGSQSAILAVVIAEQAQFRSPPLMGTQSAAFRASPVKVASAATQVRNGVGELVALVIAFGR